MYKLIWTITTFLIQKDYSQKLMAQLKSTHLYMHSLYFRKLVDSTLQLRVKVAIYSDLLTD